MMSKRLRGTVFSRALPVHLPVLAGGYFIASLVHYTLALCSEHTFAANVTIWAEAGFGLALLIASGLLLGRRLAVRRFPAIWL